MQLTSFIILFNVTCVSSFRFNLSLVSQLVHHENYLFFLLTLVFYKTNYKGRQLEWVSHMMTFILHIFGV